MIPSAVQAETKHPVRHSLSLLLCCPSSYNPVTSCLVRRSLSPVPHPTASLWGLQLLFAVAA